MNNTVMKYKEIIEKLSTMFPDTNFEVSYDGNTGVTSINSDSFTIDTGNKVFLMVVPRDINSTELVLGAVEVVIMDDEDCMPIMRFNL